MIVVDTNVISELMKSSPADSVRDWMLRQHQTELFTTSITVAEILYGIEQLPDGQRKDMLRIAATEVFVAFENHVLPFGREDAVAYALLVHRRNLLGLPINGFDAQIAAICAIHNATLATRNGKDFEHSGITIIDPWMPA
jgi:predicted nucleic acid-binding protein